MSTPVDWAPLAEQVDGLLRAGKPEEALKVLETVSAAADTGEPGPPPGFREVAGALYWKRKSLAGSVWLSLEVAGRLEAALREAGGSPDERIVRPLAGTYYNLASFCWDGWDEPGIEITPQLLRTGQDAAMKALEVRCDPQCDGMKFGFTPAMAHWMVGGFHLSVRDYASARRGFETAAELNDRAGASSLLERGYAHLADCLAAPGDDTARQRFQAVLDELAGRTDDNDAGFFREQLVTAERVFSR